MLKTEAAHAPDGRVLLLDSITKIGVEDAGAIVVTGFTRGDPAQASLRRLIGA